MKTIKVELQPVEIEDSPLHNAVEIRHIGTRSVPDLRVFFSSERSEWVICIEQATDDSGCLFEWVEVATA